MSNNLMNALKSAKKKPKFGATEPSMQTNKLGALIQKLAGKNG